MTTPDPRQIGCGGWTPQNQPAKEKAEDRLARMACSPSSKTPLTDAKMFSAWTWDTQKMDYVPHGVGVPAEFCRKLETALVDAAGLLAEIMRDEVNHQDEAEKWLRAYAPQHLFSENDRTLAAADGGPSST